MFDRDGNLWVGTVGKGLFRIHGNVVDHYDHTNGLSGDSVWALYEDREGIVWAGTTSGIDNFRDPLLLRSRRQRDWPKDLAAGHSGQQRRHDMGSQCRIAGPHRQRQRLINSRR